MLPDRLIKLLLVAAVAIAAGLYWLQQSQVYENKGRLSARQLSDASNTVVLSWHSDIEVPMVRRFEEAFAEWRSKTARFVVDLNSRGGALLEGRKMIELIDRMNRSHTVDSNVGPGAGCLSMCVPIYLQGQTRMASASSRWMFHEPQYYELFSDEKADGNERERKALAGRFFEKYFVNSPITPAWREQLKAEWQGKDVWRTGQQLVDEGSGVITQLY